eukprot:7875957-Heterocapsa_arctica.AAC.1
MRRLQRMREPQKCLRRGRMTPDAMRCASTTRLRRPQVDVGEDGRRQHRPGRQATLCNGLGDEEALK